MLNGLPVRLFPPENLVSRLALAAARAKGNDDQGGGRYRAGNIWRPNIGPATINLPPIMPKILYLVTEDWFFVSHFLPMAQAARDCGLQVAVATRVRDGRRAARGRRIFRDCDRERARQFQSVAQPARFFSSGENRARTARRYRALHRAAAGGDRRRCGQARRDRSSRFGADRFGTFVDRARHRRACRPQDRERHCRLVAARSTDPVSVRESR